MENKIYSRKLINIICCNSVFMLFFAKLWQKYHSLETLLGRAIKESQAYNFLNFLQKTSRVSFKFSLLGKITENNNSGNLIAALVNSKVIDYFLNVCGHWKERLAGCLETSIIDKQAIGIKNKLNILPVKTISVFIILVILSNILLYALFKNYIQQDFGFLGWIIKGVLLLVGLTGLFCAVSLEDLKSTSFFLKLINHSKLSD